MRGNRAGKMFEVTQKAKREVKKIKDIAKQERNRETRKREMTYTIIQKYCTRGKANGKEFKSSKSEYKPVFLL